MNSIGRKIVKHLADSLIKSTNNKVVLFTKEVSDLVDKVTRSKSEVETEQKDREAAAESTDESLKQDERASGSNGDSKETSGQENICDKVKEEGKKGTNTSNVKARTTAIIASIINSNSEASLLKRLENLNEHLKRHPEGTHHANRVGTQGLLLKLKKKTKDSAIHEVLNETLSLTGYCEPPPSSGVRVLSIDGGGMRGLVVISMLQQLEYLSGKRIHQLFDYVCGVSTGAIITCCLVPPITLDLKKLRALYLELGRQIFKQNAIKGAGKLVFNCAYYETTVWERLLKSHVGSLTLLETTRFPRCPKISVLSTVGSGLRVVPFLFRNYSPPEERDSDYPGSCSHSMFEAMRASAAAPSVFEEFQTGRHLHLDGGIVANNPAGVAIHEVKSLWPEESVSCLVSCGTGKDPRRQDRAKRSASWKRILDKVLESATDTEAVHTILNDLLEEDVYHRFNPTLTNTFAIDEIDERKIELLEGDTEDFCKRNEKKFSAVVKKLTESRPFLEKCKDRIKMQIKLNESPK